MSKALVSKPVGDLIEAPTFTVKMARDGFGDLDAAVAAVVSERHAVERVAGHVMWNAALLTYNVLEVNKGEYIGSGEDKPWKDQTDYVVKGLGFSKGYGTTLKRLGRAAVVHGVTRGSAEWGFLASHAQLAPVGKAIALDDTEEFRRLIKGYAAEMRAHGAIKGSARTPQIASEGEGEGSGEGSGESAPAPATERPATVADILNALDAAAKAADREGWAAIEDRLSRIIEREVTLRAKQS